MHGRRRAVCPIQHYWETVIHLADLHREKAAEKGPVAAQRKAEILGGDILSALPLGLEFRSFSRERFGEALRRHGYKTVCVLYRASRFVNKTYLDRIPPSAKILSFIGRKERRGRFSHSWSGCGSCG
jgi:hypothetical protein